MEDSNDTDTEPEDNLTKRNYEGLTAEETNSNVDVEDDSSEESAGPEEEDFNEAVEGLNAVVATNFRTEIERRSNTESQRRTPKILSPPKQS